jgi:hypothetical protein
LSPPQAILTAMAWMIWSLALLKLNQEQESPMLSSAKQTVQ